MDNTSHFATELAKKYQAPLVVVERLIAEETTLVSREARISTFVPIFAARRVEERLRKRVHTRPTVV